MMKEPQVNDFVHLVTQTYVSEKQLEWITVGATVANVRDDGAVDLVIRAKRPKTPDRELGANIPYGGEQWTENFGVQCVMCNKDVMHWHWPKGVQL